MIITRIFYLEKQYEIDLAKPLDISIPVGRTQSPNAFYLSEPHYNTVEAGSFIGDVSRGGSCNCEDIIFNPHGNGTHTECAGHISSEKIFITDVLKRFFFPTLLLSVSAENGVISKELIEKSWKKGEIYEAAIIRTLPNEDSKKIKNYSGSNPIYFSSEAIDFLNQKGITHLLTDLPSLDKEDDGLLLAHHTFFGFPEKWNLEKTVTEMVFVPNEIEDGFYWMNLQICSFESDASPSKPILYKSRLV